MLTKDDISQIGKVVDEGITRRLGENNRVLRAEFAEVIEQNISPQFEKVNSKLDLLETRLATVEHKIDRALYHELDQHNRWIHLIADKVGIDLVRE